MRESILSPKSYETLRRERISAAMDRFFAPGNHILDIGAGSGVFSMALLKQGCQVTAIESDGNQVARLKKGLPPNPRLVIIHDTFPPARLTSELQLGSVDGAVVLEVLEHSPNPEDILSSIARILRPRGRLLISTANRYSWISIIGMIKFFFLGRFLNPGNSRIWQFSSRQIARMLKKTGFRIVYRGSLSRFPLFSFWPFNRAGTGLIFVAEKRP